MIHTPRDRLSPHPAKTRQMAQDSDGTLYCLFGSWVSGRTLSLWLLGQWFREPHFTAGREETPPCSSLHPLVYQGRGSHPGSQPWDKPFPVELRIFSSKLISRVILVPRERKVGLQGLAQSKQATRGDVPLFSSASPLTHFCGSPASCTMGHLVLTFVTVLQDSSCPSLPGPSPFHFLQASSSSSFQSSLGPPSLALRSQFCDP